MENLGLIDRVSKPGQRGDFFQLSQNPFSSLLEGINVRIKRSLKNTSHARNHLPKGLKSTQARLAKLEHFYQGFLANNEQLIETLHD